MESPVIVENCANFATPANTNETGFPFDDSDYDSQDHFQSRLNDLAKRHPDLANHLRLDDFPSFRRKRQESGSSSHDPEERPSTSRFAEHGFPSGFNRFPFSRHFEEDFINDPRREDKPPEAPKKEEKRGRKQNPYLPQHLSNTVDLGQKQPPVEETRSQRSMSAPPENRSSTTNSRVENNPTPQQPEPQQRPQQEEQPPHTMGNKSSQPKERIIPIQVEGRDEPVMPKNPNIPTGGSTEKVFGNERVYSGHHPQYQQYGHPQQQQRHMDEPDSFQYVPKHVYEQFMPQPPPKQHQQPFTRKTPPPQGQYPTQPPYSQGQQHPPQSPHSQGQQYPSQPPHPQGQQHSEQQQHAKQQQQEPQPKQIPLSNDPLEKIKSVRSEVMELMTNVENFRGTRKDRKYLYLDEMLTRNLLKLDDIDTDGKENIRLARKEAIKCIQTCISNLEAKAQAREKEIAASNSSEISQNTSDSNPSSDMIQSEQQHSEKTNDPPKFTSSANLVLSSPKPEDCPGELKAPDGQKSEDKMESGSQSEVSSNPSTANVSIQTPSSMDVVKTSSSDKLTVDTSQSKDSTQK